ncbi:MAG: flagellar motor switch protein FliN [Acidobacteriia bacterium]|nr:flagellar motor switch protein FliN [Terriglobia bacterium]
MPEATMALTKYLEEWRSGISTVLTQLAGEAVACECGPSSAAPATGGVVACFESAGPIHGSLALAFEEAAAAHLARMFMGEPPAEATALTPEDRDAVSELARQFAGTVALAIKAAVGKCELSFTSVDPPSWPAAATHALLLRRGTQSLTMGLLMGHELTDSLSVPEPAPTPAPSTSPTSTEPLPPNRNFDLLLDVELRVRLRFGKRTMQLKEIVALNAGSVVELEQHVEEPAELLVDDKVLARGEVVVVDGNYGLRVTEIVAPSQRLASLSS